MFEDELKLKLGLSNKSINALVQIGVQSIEDFKSVDLSKVLDLPFMGKSTYEILVTKQLDIQDDPSIVDDVEVDKESLFFKKNIYHLLKPRTRRVIDTLEIKDVDQFLLLKKEQVMILPKMGITTWNDINEVQKKCIEVLGDTNSESLEWFSIYNNFSRFTQIKLDRLGVDSVKKFIKLDRETLLGRSDGSSNSRLFYNEIIQVRDRLRNDNNKDRDLIPLKEFPLFFDVEDLPDISISKELRNTLLSEIFVDKQIVQILTKYDILNLQSILLTHNDSLKKVKELKKRDRDLMKKSISEFCEFSTNGEFVTQELLGNSYEDFISSLLEYSNVNDYISQIVRLRIIDGLVMAEIARMYDVTREVPRQKVSKFKKSIYQSYKGPKIMELVFSNLDSIIDEYGGLIGLDELLLVLEERFEWIPSGLVDGFESFIYHFYERDGVEINQKTLKVPHECNECGLLGKEINEFLLHNYPVDKVHITEVCTWRHICQKNRTSICNRNNDIKISIERIKEFSKEFEFKCIEDYIYSEYGWVLRHSGLKRRVEVASLLYGKIVTPEIILDELLKYETIDGHKRWEESIKLRDVHRHLIGAEDVFTWGRREFIHKENIHIDHNIIGTIRNILESLLVHAPFVALYKVYTDFKLTFHDSGIPNDFALTTVINIYIPELYVDKYRYVYLEKQDTPTSIDSAVEEYIFNSGGEIPYDKLSDWITKTIGSRESLLMAVIYRCKSIITNRDGYLIHIDNTDLDEDTFSTLLQKIENVIDDDEFANVNKVFEEFQIDCLSLGIDNPKFLFDMISYYSKRIDASSFPHLVTVDFDKNISIRNMVSNYILESERIVSQDEIIHKFEDSGYNPEVIIMTIYFDDNILRVYQGCYIHRKYLEWTEDKNENLNKQIRTYFKDRLDRGDLFGSIDDFLENYEDSIPDVSIGWNAVLLFEFVRKFDSVVFVGNCQNAFLITNINPKITNLGELTKEVILKNFSGGCSRPILNEWMVSHKIVRKQVTPLMVKDTEGLVVNNFECFVEVH